MWYIILLRNNFFQFCLFSISLTVYEVHYLIWITLYTSLILWIFVTVNAVVLSVIKTFWFEKRLDISNLKFIYIKSFSLDFSSNYCLNIESMFELPKTIFPRQRFWLARCLWWFAPLVALQLYDLITRCAFFDFKYVHKITYFEQEEMENCIYWFTFLSRRITLNQLSAFMCLFFGYKIKLNTFI